MTVNRQWRLARRPRGMVQETDFTWAEEPVPTVGPGQVLVRNLYLSMDPTQRGWMSRDTYIPAMAVGEVVRSFGVGQVVGSRHDGFKQGDIVQGGVGWQDYLLTDGGGPLPIVKLPAGVDMPLAMSVLGLTGITAYFGLLEVGRPKAGETVVVSGAAGATGSVVGQIAKIEGCHVVGIAGGPDKCGWLTREAGFDAAIDYKAERVDRRLRELCPNGIDIFFDNVGGRDPGRRPRQSRDARPGRRLRRDRRLQREGPAAGPPQLPLAPRSARAHGGIHRPRLHGSRR